MFTYIPEAMYLALRSQAEPGEERWESRLVRRIIRDWLDRNVVSWNDAPPMTPPRR